MYIRAFYVLKRKEKTKMIFNFKNYMPHNNVENLIFRWQNTKTLKLTKI